jgi:rsbT antagonist protein RsbS
MTTKIPILKVDGFLVASIQVALDDRSVTALQSDLLNKVAAESARGVLIDVTAIDVIDSFLARSLNDMSVAVHLLGAKLVIVGIQPAVAITLVKLGLTIPDAVTALNLEKGLKLLRKIGKARSPDAKDSSLSAPPPDDDD